MSFSKQRVFAHSDSMNYNDYLKMKNGQTMLKTCKNSNNDGCLNYFLNYQDFLILTKSYYNHLNSNKCNLQFQTNMYETNQSFIRNQAVLNHVNSCNYCLKFKKTNSFTNSLDKNTCYQLLSILYPFGVYEDINKSNIYFPSKIKLNDWCFNNKKK